MAQIGTQIGTDRDERYTCAESESKVERMEAEAKTQSTGRGMNYYDIMERQGMFCVAWGVRRVWCVWPYYGM